MLKILTNIPITEYKIWFSESQKWRTVLSTLNLESLDRYYFRFKFLIYGITYPVWGLISYFIITENEPYWERFVVGGVSFIYSFYCQRVIEKYGPVKNRIISQLIDLMVIIHYYSLVDRSENWGENVLISYVFGFLVVMFATGFTSRSIVEIVNWSVLSFMATILVAMKLEFMSPLLFILFIITLILFIMTIGVFSVKLLDQFKILNKNIESILQNLSQGIFTFAKDLKINKEYSQFLEKILGKKNLEGQNVIDLLFKESSLIHNQVDETKEILNSFLGENVINFEINHDLLPKEVIKTINGQEKVLELNWEAINNDIDEVEKTMVILKDVTELRLLQKESEKQKQELKYIGEIVKNGVENTFNFLESQASYVIDCEQILDKEILEEEDYIKLFRNLHTLKGNFKVYDFTLLVTCLHEAEQYLSLYRKNEVVELYKIRTYIELIKSNIDIYKNMILEKIGLNSFNKHDAFHSKFYEFFCNISKDNEADSIVNSLKEFEKLQNFEPLSNCLNKVLESVPKLASQLGKACPVVTFNNNFLVNKSYSGLISDLFNHLIRNSLDHGLESESERLENNKKSHGTITIDTNVGSDVFKFIYKDDGKGLDINSLKNKGINNKLLTQESSLIEIANLIFAPGISTASQVTEISGRGVGMDAVRSFVREKGGDVIIELGRKLNNEHYNFWIVVELPTGYFLKDKSNLSPLSKVS